MAESNEIQSVGKLMGIAEDNKSKVTMATQCIKAQSYLVGKLKKQVKCNKETCDNISSANSILKSEITQAEQEIQSFHIAMETIRSANVELRREWLVAKENKLDIKDKVETGEEKYEKLWLEAKSRFESLPYVQNVLKAEEKAQSLREQIATLIKQAESLEKEIDDKKKARVMADRKIIIELAEFLVRERPKLIDSFNKKSKEVADLTNKLKKLKLNSVAETKIAKNDVTVKETKATPKTVDEPEMSAFTIPSLQMFSVDMDTDDLFSIKLEQVKRNKADDTLELEKKESSCLNMGISQGNKFLGISIFNQETDIDDSISAFLIKQDIEEKAQNFSRKKLINILEDVKIDANDAMNMISIVNLDTLQPVETIAAESKTTEVPGVFKNKASKGKGPILCQEIEEIEMVSSNVQEIVEPPTQFLDETLKTQKSQEHKKTVTFDLSASKNDAISGNTNKTDAPEENVDNETIMPLDVTDDGFSKIKDMVLKKYNLDMTPPFVYAKNTGLQMKTEHKIVTSKFFRGNETVEDETKQTEQADPIQPGKLENKIADSEKANSSKVVNIGVDDNHSSPKEPKIPDELYTLERPFSGYPFNHGAQGLPDSLDVSINTTGYEDVDDFPHCIDSNLLLSPKADLPMCVENPEVQSQDTANFLSGLRKTGFSFFGIPAKDTTDKPGTSTPNQGTSTFSFNFGGEEKKNRGGLFSMFQ